MQSLPSVKEGGSRGSSSLELVKCSRHRPKGPRTAGTETPKSKSTGPSSMPDILPRILLGAPAGFRPNQHFETGPLLSLSRSP